MTKKEKAIRTIPYGLVLVFAYYLLPLLFSELVLKLLPAKGGEMLLMLFLMPLIVIVNAYLHGRKLGFCPWFVLSAAVLFLPAVYLIFVSNTAFVYTFIFGGLTLLFDLLGHLAWKTRNKK